MFKTEHKYNTRSSNEYKYGRSVTMCILPKKNNKKIAASIKVSTLAMHQSLTLLLLLKKTVADLPSLKLSLRHEL